MRNGGEERKICKLVGAERMGPLLQPASQLASQQQKYPMNFWQGGTLHCVQVYEEKICLINSPVFTLGQKGYSECHCKYLKLQRL